MLIFIDKRKTPESYDPDVTAEAIPRLSLYKHLNFMSISSQLSMVAVLHHIR